MPYYGNEPAKVAVKIGSGVITTTEIQDGQVYTADILDNAITASKLDDDGTGFQVGSLGIGTAVSGTDLLKVGGTASFTGDITGTLATASQGNITSVGTLTSLTTSGSIVSDVGGNADVGLRLQRASSSGRAQYTLENESGEQLWRCGLTGGGGTTYTFWNTTANVLQLSYSDNSATFGGAVGVNNATNLGSYGKLQIDGQGSSQGIALYGGGGAGYDITGRIWLNSGRQFVLGCNTNQIITMDYDDSSTTFAGDVQINKSVPSLVIGNGGNTTQATIRLGGDNSSGGRLYFSYNGDSSYIDCYGGHGGTDIYRNLSVIARNLYFKTGSNTQALYIDNDQNATFAGDVASDNFSSGTNIQSDMNSLKKNGFYRIDNGNYNQPVANTHYSCTVTGNQDNVVSQWAVHLTNGQTYTRCFNSSWSSWVRIDD